MRYSKTFLLTSLGIVFAAIMAREDAPAQTPGPTEPGGDLSSVAMAGANPDEYAWKLFEYINLQAEPGKAGVPALGKAILTYDPDTPTVWETWALASGDGTSQNGSEVYKPDGGMPVAWNLLPRAAPAPKHFSANFTFNSSLGDDLGLKPTLPMTGKQKSGQNKIFVGPGNPAGEFEVRMNKPAFTFVVDNELYNTQGLAAKLTAARASGNRDLISFPAAAKEIKAVWVPTTNSSQISADEKARYHWRKVGGKYYKLAGFHVITRDLKLWYWADFAQEDYETNGRDLKPAPALPSLDTTTRGPNAPARGSMDGERKELSGSKWGHYRLRGSQIAYVDAAGKPNVVGNTLIENGFANRSSCMTCHFRATVGDALSGGGNTSLSPGRKDLGTPLDGQLGMGSTISYLQTDFVWSAAFRAQPKQK